MVEELRANLPTKIRVQYSIENSTLLCDKPRAIRGRNYKAEMVYSAEWFLALGVVRDEESETSDSFDSQAGPFWISCDARTGNVVMVRESDVVRIFSEASPPGDIVNELHDLTQA